MCLATSVSSTQKPLAHRLLATASQRLQARMEEEKKEAEAEAEADRGLSADHVAAGDEEMWCSLERALSLLVQRVSKGEVLFDGAALRAQLTGAPANANASFGGPSLGEFSREFGGSEHLLAGGMDKSVGRDAEGDLCEQLAEFMAAALDFLCGENSSPYPFAGNCASFGGGVSGKRGAWPALVETSARLAAWESELGQIRSEKLFLESERKPEQTKLEKLQAKEQVKDAQVNSLRERQSLLKRDVERVSQIAQNCLTLLVLHCCTPQSSASTGWSAKGSKAWAAGRGGKQRRLWSTADGSGLAQRLEKVDSVRGQRNIHT